MTRLNLTKRAIESFPPPPAGKSRAYYYDEKVKTLAVAVSPKGRRVFCWYKKVKGSTATLLNVGPYPEFSIEQARSVALEWNARAARGDNPAQERRARREELTFAELFELFVERHVRPRSGERAVRELRRSFKLYLETPLGRRRLSEVTPGGIARVHAELGQRGRIHAANRTLALLSSMFNRAREWSLFTAENPARLVKKFRETPRDRYLTDEEVKQFRAALRSERNVDLRDFLVCLLFTGQRESRVRSMRWDALDLARGTWSLRASAAQKPVPTVVALPRIVVWLLKLRRRALPPDVAWVFPGRPPRKAVSNPGFISTFKTGWDAFRKRAGLEDVRLHDLRRTLATWMISAGVPLPVVSKQLGHRTLTITGVYARADQAAVREAVTQTSRRLLAATNGGGRTEAA
jgi:integrase